MAELDRYSRMLDLWAQRGLAPMVTFSHFSVPLWFAARGGFEVADGADLFARFAEKATERLGDRMAAATTFNEANVQRLLALIRKSDAQTGIDAMLEACGKRCGSARFSSLVFTGFKKTEPVLLDAHHKAMAAINAGPGRFPVGISLTMQDVQCVGWINLAKVVTGRLYGPWLDEAKGADFIGVQTSTRVQTGLRGRIDPPADAEMTTAGYEFYPQALDATIRLAAARTGTPVYVPENGIATDDDSHRIAYIDAALAEVQACINEGIDVRSFIQWSLLDNYEWTASYGQRFGVVEVDFDTFERKPRASAFHLGSRARQNLLG